MEQPSVSMPRGGGAIQGIGEKFTANPVTGTASFSIPLPATPGRGGRGPQVSLSYNSGAGNGPFGIGWTLDVPSIRRKTDRGLPRYIDTGDAADTFVLSGFEDLVPALDPANSFAALTREWTDGGVTWDVTRYRPRVESAFAAIERFRKQSDGTTHWRTISKDNTKRYYGLTSQARVSDPDDASRVFGWLLEEEHDEVGNITVYAYETDDGSSDVDLSAPAERSRQLNGHKPVYAYLKRVSYCNAAAFSKGNYRFHLVFDYGDHHATLPELTPGGSWSQRQDSFSSFRSGFDVRCYRLCSRVLMFHDFVSIRDDGGTPTPASVPAVVRSLELTHEASGVATRLTQAQQKGWRWNGTTYDTDTLPAVDLGYTEATVDESVQFVSGLDDLPNGLDTSQWRFVDLDGEGLSGLLSQQADAWYYKRNEGAGVFGRARRLGSRPSFPLGAPGTQLTDLGGDGKLDVVVMRPDLAGYQSRTQDGGWEPFRHFKQRPTTSPSDPDARMIDLDGDGIADLMITEDRAFRWYPSEGKDGFGNARRTFQAANEDHGPRLVFSREGETIFLADMTGDGLTDLVRIRNGAIVYWPNRGYGRFGAKVIMDSAPWFDAPDRFDHRRIRLADIDGAGPTDLLYIGPDGVRFWLNQSGNGFGSETTLARFPSVAMADQVQLSDIRGDGTACLVWSSPLMKDAWQPLRYVRLMSEGKPYLLKSITNGRGAETRLTYVPSTQFYASDRRSGSPWATRLAFPVQTLQKVEKLDHITGWKFSTTYAYHHGYFDGPEREFRGFGLVDQWDTESFSDFEDPDLDNSNIEHHRDPVRTRTWFHTGAWRDGQRLETAYQAEYYAGDASAASLAAPGITDESEGAWSGVSQPDPTTAEVREAHRALKGRMLRQEVYAEDGTASASDPYTVTEQTFQVVRLQPASGAGHAVFRVAASESLSYQYDRESSDPRVSHQLTLQTDEYGNMLKTAAVSYPRRNVTGRKTEQETLSIVVTEAEFINQDDELPDDTDNPTGLDVWHVGVGYRSKSWHLTGTSGISESALATASGLSSDASSASSLEFEEAATTGLQKRLLSDQVTLFYNDTLTGALSLDTLGARALPYEQYVLAVTSGLHTDIFPTTGTFANRVSLTDFRDDGGYVQLDPDGSSSTHLWLPSGKLTLNGSGFYEPTKATDPFGNETTFTWDADKLSLSKVTDAALNETEVTDFDYRVMAPRSVDDANNTTTDVRFDVLGRVTQIAIHDGTNGDTDIDDATTGGDAGPTTKFTYADTQWSGSSLPNYVKVESRKTHGGAWPTLAADLQTSFAYSDGSGNVVQTKVQAEDGDVPKRDVNGDLVFDGSGDLEWENSTDRWIGTGRTVVDNKGNVVKQYEPFFAGSSEYDPETELTEWGVTPIFEYDPVGRNTRVELPDSSERLWAFSPWRLEARDENDNYAGTDTAHPAYDHKNTPTVTHLDALGRVFRTDAYLDDEGNVTNEDTDTDVLRTSVSYDIQGNPLTVTDPRGNDIQVQTFDLLGRPLFTGAADEGYGVTAGAGETRILPDVAGQVVQTWRSHDASNELVLTRTFDALRRPLTLTHTTDGGTTEPLVEYRVYGEFSGVPTTAKARGQLYRLYDTAGELEITERDFKGNVVEMKKTLPDDFTVDEDWTGIAANTSVSAIDTWLSTGGGGGTLMGDSFVLERTFDALNRLITETGPDAEIAGSGAASVTTNGYDKGGRLQTVQVAVRGGSSVTYVADITYNARGQRLTIVKGDDAASSPTTTDYATTTYTYDAERLWLTGLVTTRDSDSEKLQDLSYTRDLVGNITEIDDAAQSTLYHNNTQVSRTRTFAYDPLYRLSEATGREKDALAQPGPSLPTKYAVPAPGVQDALMRNYTQSYFYDAAGNLTEMKHVANSATQWRRGYHLEADCNQLLKTSEPGDTFGTPSTYSRSYSHNWRGAMTFLPHLYNNAGADNLTRDYRDQLRKAQLNAGDAAHYVYDAAGNRVAKQVEAGQNDHITLYLWGYEVYREVDTTGPTIKEERHTLHVMDDQQRIALVETRTITSSGSYSHAPTPLSRFQLDDHLGTACVEVDEAMAVISYEEFHPFGSTAWWASNATIEKRYRFTGKERDNESGLHYHGQRYYAAWLGRWERADPMGLGDGGNQFAYSGNRPVVMRDPSGLGEFDGWANLAADAGIDPAAVETWLAKKGDAAVEAAAPYLEKGMDLAVRGMAVAQGVGAIGEGVVGAGLTAAPSPWTKALGVGMLFVAADDLQNAGQISATGRDIPTVRRQLAEGFATGLGRSPEEAGRAGDAVEVLSAAGVARGSRQALRHLGGLGARGGAVVEGVVDAGGAPNASRGTETIFRVQGGVLPNASKVRFALDDAGNVSIHGDDMLFVNLGQEGRALEFLAKRGDQAELVRFEVTAEFAERLRSQAVPQRLGRQFPGRPQAVDATRAADQFGIPSEMFDDMMNNIVPGTFSSGRP